MVNQVARKQRHKRIRSKVTGTAARSRRAEPDPAELPRAADDHRSSDRAAGKRPTPRAASTSAAPVRCDGDPASHAAELPTRAVPRPPGATAPGRSRHRIGGGRHRGFPRRDGRPLPGVGRLHRRFSPELPARLLVVPAPGHAGRALRLGPDAHPTPRDEIELARPLWRVPRAASAARRTRTRCPVSILEIKVHFNGV